MEKLKLEEIVGYLPYGLKIYFESLDGTEKEFWILDCSKVDFMLSNNNKPILRPLSDITKDIGVDGLKFVPMIELSEIFDFDFNGDGFELTEDLTIIYHSYSDTEGFMFPSNFWINVYQKLYSWHFDIHNLINRGLAIDINTVKNG